MSIIYGRLFIATIIALILTILPLPDIFIGLRPPWVLMLILYLQLFLPDYFKIYYLIILGLVLDVLLSTLLGQHVFALALVSWIASSKARRFRLFSIGQQMALIGFFCLLYQLLIFMMDASLGYSVRFAMAVGSAMISILLWPWLRLIADDTLLINKANRR